MDIGNTSGESHMDIDEESPAPPPPLTPGANEDSDDEDEDPSDVAMVPMADMLNARYGSENVGFIITSNTYFLVEMVSPGKTLLREN